MCPVKTNLNRKIKMRHVKTRKVLRYKRGYKKIGEEQTNNKNTDIKFSAH